MPLARAVVLATVLVAACGVAPAAADPGGPIVTCHPSTEGGTDTDTCVGNPDVAGGSHDEFQVGVVPCFTFGIGIGFGSSGCDD